MKTVLVTLALVLLALSASGGPADDAGTAPDPSRLTLEELLAAEVVEGAARYPQNLADAPASVTLITAEDITRYGWRTFADLLRSVRGVQVSNDRNYSYAGVRGFAVPGDYGTRLLVLLDGHRLNDSIYDGVLAGSEFPVDLENIERVEVIRGPASSLYGSNAMFGVVNVVMRRGLDLSRPVLATSVGSFGTYATRAAYGNRWQSGLDLLVSASLLRSSGQDLLFPELGRRDDSDADRSRRLFARLRHGDWGIQVVHSSRTKHVPTASYDTVVDGVQEETTDAVTLVDARYERAIASGVSLLGKVGYSHYGYRGTYPYGPSAQEVEDDSASGGWGGGDALLRVSRLEHHVLSLGAEYRNNFLQHQMYTYAPDDLRWEDRSSSLAWGLFVQDEYAPWKRVRFSAGLRYDHHDSFAGRVSPRVALFVDPAERTRVKLVHGRAYRAPNPYELRYYSPQPSLRPEAVSTLELMLEQGLGRNLHLSASAYRYEVEELIALTTDGEGGLFFRNSGNTRSHGFEVELRGRLHRRVDARLSWALQRTEDAESGSRLANSPAHLVRLNLAFPLWGDRLQAGVELQASSQRLTLAGDPVAGYALGNVTVTAPRALGPIDVSASVYNLFGTRYADPGSAEHRQDSIPQDGRSFRVRLGWRL